MVEQPLIPDGRVFAAVKPPIDVVAAVDDRLGSEVIPGRRVPPENWHITLRFVGETEPVAYERWLANLDAASKPSPFRLSLGELGAFPRSARATVLWVGVHGEGITGLAEVVDDAAEASGLGREDRPFRPHLTLARIRPPEDVRQQIEARAGEERLPFRVTEFHVMAAVGGRYRVYETFQL